MTTISINLLGIEQKERNRFRGGFPIDKGWMMAVGCILGSLLVVGILTAVMNGLLASAEQEKTDLEDKVKALEGQLGEIKSMQAKKDTALAEQRILEYVTGKTYPWSKFLNEVRDITPDSLWIETIAVAGDQLTLSGNTFEHQTVAYFLANMQGSPLFETVTLTGSNKAIGKDGNSVHFTMTAKLKFDVAGPSDAAAKPGAVAPAGGSDTSAVPSDAGANANRGAAAIKGNKANAAQAGG